MVDIDQVSPRSDADRHAADIRPGATQTATEQAAHGRPKALSSLNVLSGMQPKRQPTAMMQRCGWCLQCCSIRSALAACLL